MLPKVGEIQKLSLVGQLMGVTQFYSMNFAKPKVMSLQNGNFALKYFGKFVLAVGSDRNIDDNILDYRADLLSSLLQLYHCDVERLSLINAPTGVTTDQKKLTDKLYHIFETYLPLLHYNGNFLYNISILSLPKPANNIYLDTVQVLENIQQVSGVLGGQIMYHNKVISSQLSSNLTNLFVISDPTRLKTVENIQVSFRIPLGVQLFNAYISSKEYNYLQQISEKYKTVSTISNSNFLPFSVRKKNVPKDSTLAAMKRDKSLIFTNIPEDEETTTIVRETETDAMKKPRNRPNHLPLKVKNGTSKEQPESGFSSINFDETDSYPDFIGKTSVCSTPLTENKILHGNILSICAKTNEEFENIDTQSKSDDVLRGFTSATLMSQDNSQQKDERKTKKKVIGTPRKIRLPKTEIKEIYTDKNPQSTKASQPLSSEAYKFFLNPFKSVKRRNSSNDLNKSTHGKEDHEESDNEGNDSKISRKRSSSISDPTFSVCNQNGAPISENLFSEFLKYQYLIIQEKKSSKKQLNKLNFSMTGNQNEIKNAGCKSASDDCQAFNENESTAVSTIPKLSRKDLSLPLKSLNHPQSIESEVNRKKPLFESSLANRGKLQLTPLMAKLTALAMNDERCVGNGSCVVETPVDLLSKRRPSVPRSEPLDIESLDDGKLHKVEVFVCNQQNTTMIVILKEDSLRKYQTIQTLFDVCVSKLPKLESSLHQILNLNVEGDKGDFSYSFMEIDSENWGLIDKVGPWAQEDLTAVETMHKDLKQYKSFTEITLRSDENVLFGYKSGDNQIFYQQAQSGIAGILPPSDIMGIVGSIAKRRLERDHSIVLL